MPTLNSIDPARIVLDRSCNVRCIADAHAGLLRVPPAATEIELDCASVERADISLVQLVASAAATFAARNATLTLLEVPEPMLAAFSRAAIPLPGAARRVAS